MPTQYPDLFAALAAPFAPHEVKSRDHNGRHLLYITARTAMNRLDEILGPENWTDSYVASETSVLCLLTIRLPDGTAITKCDAGGHAGMKSQEDDEKSAYSDAFKRACVKFGVGRYLYRDGVPGFVTDRCGAVVAPASEPPAGPEPRRGPWGGGGGAGPDPRRAPASGGNGDRTYDGPPRTGKALFAFLKQVEQERGIPILQYMTKWGKHNDFPARMIDWDDAMVADGYRAACHRLATAQPVSPSGDPEPPDEFDQEVPY
jgi:hypothetical protein